MGVQELPESVFKLCQNTHDLRNPHRASLPYAMESEPVHLPEYDTSDFEAVLATLTAKFECFPSAMQKITTCICLLDMYMQAYRTPHDLQTILERDIRREIAVRLDSKHLDQILINAYMEQLRQPVIDPDIIAALAGLDPFIATPDSGSKLPRFPIG
ncbi:hypothetical protein GCM10023116_22550 [Kistimonas scapharcae]|uniref:Uncharacterized protein n=2 Tax=Kistimonas scapharcae TaxID=1036133 RepID=A0ABP8V2B4_9GAMM